MSRTKNARARQTCICCAKHCTSTCYAFLRMFRTWPEFCSAFVAYLASVFHVCDVAGQSLPHMCSYLARVFPCFFHILGQSSFSVSVCTWQDILRLFMYLDRLFFLLFIAPALWEFNTLTTLAFHSSHNSMEILIHCPKG